MSVDIADLIFVRLAHVEDEEIIAVIETMLQFARSDFRNVQVAFVFFFTADAAKLVVIDELVYQAIRAAHRASFIFAQLQLAELQRHGVEQQQTAGERITFAENQLDGLHGLQRADNSRQYAKHAAFGATGHQARRRRLRIQASVARAIGHAEDGHLPFKAENRAVDIGLAEKDAGVVHQIARGKIVGAVDDDVVILEKFQRVFAGEFHLVSGDLNVGIEIREARAGSFRFWLADVAGAKGHLALEIGVVHDIEVHQADVADARGGEIEPKRRAESTGADEQHFGGFELELTVHADFGHDQVAAVAQDFFV